MIGVSSCAKWIAYIIGRWGLGGGGPQVLLPRAPHTLGTPLCWAVAIENHTCSVLVHVTNSIVLSVLDISKLHVLKA